MGELGRIRAFEVTHGRKGTNNGWHPHYHFLQFCQVKADAAQLMDWRTRLYLRWDACCQRAGLGSPSFAHGIDLQDGRKADRYISKWGLEDELTRGHTKKGRAGGETPFDLLRAVLADKEDRQAAALFLEFSQCFKGKRQLSWSNGLKARFNQAEKDDQEIASEAVEDAQLLGLLTVQQWRDVLKVKARATVLELAAAGGWPSVSRFLWFIDGAAEVSSSMQTCSQRRVRSSWVGWRFHKHSDRLCLSAISVGPSGYGAAPHVLLSAGSAQRKSALSPAPYAHQWPRRGAFSPWQSRRCAPDKQVFIDAHVWHVLSST